MGSDQPRRLSRALTSRWTRLGAATLLVAGIATGATVYAESAKTAGASASPSVIGAFKNFTINGTTLDYYQPPTPTIAVHMNLLPTGDVLMVGPFKYNYPPWSATAYVYNPTPGAPNNGFVKEVDPPDNIFCSGISTLSDGTVVLVGGRLHDTKLAGPPLVFTFDPWTLTWTQQPSLPVGLFYPTTTELPNGSLIATSGGTETGSYNETVQILAPATPYLKLSQTGPILGYNTLYPRQWVMPDGDVISYEEKYGFVISTSNPDPTKWTATPLPASQFVHAGYGPGSIMLPSKGDAGSSKMIIFGGGNNAGSATNNVEELDDQNLAAGWKSLAPFPVPARDHSNAVLLPNGTVFLAGGNSQGTWNQPTHQELLYNPTTNTWTGLASNDPTINRGYHSTAVLLPSGQVLTGGDNGGAVVNGKAVSDHGGRLEIYDPPYLFQGARPTITSAPTAVSWNQPFDVTTPSDVTKVMLMAPADQTHSVNMNQTTVDMPFTKTATGISLTAPSQNVSPPGYYMLFLVNKGVPSVASWIHVGGVAPTVTGLSPRSGPFAGGTQVTITGTGFTNAVGVKFGSNGTTFHVDSDTQITATVPVPAAPGADGMDVTVETATSQSATTSADKFTYAGPFVTGFSSRFASFSGGTTVAVLGVNFAPGDTVTVGGKPPTSVTVVNSGKITLGVPAGTGDAAPVIVTNPAGLASPATASSDLDYAPSVNDGGKVDGPLAVVPAYATISGGTTPVTIEGSNFIGATRVTFAGTPAKWFKVISKSQIQAIPPKGPEDTMYGDVTVVSPGGTSTPTALSYFCWYKPSLGQTPTSCTNVPPDGGA